MLSIPLLRLRIHSAQFHALFTSFGTQLIKDKIETEWHGKEWKGFERVKCWLQLGLAQIARRWSEYLKVAQNAWTELRSAGQIHTIWTNVAKPTKHIETQHIDRGSRASSVLEWPHSVEGRHDQWQSWPNNPEPVCNCMSEGIDFVVCSFLLTDTISRPERTWKDSGFKPSPASNTLCCSGPWRSSCIHRWTSQAHIERKIDHFVSRSSEENESEESQGLFKIKRSSEKEKNKK